MFAVKPYYLSSSGTIDYSEGYIFSHVDSSFFNMEVPLASSIESTMEWCNRVGERHRWAEYNDSLFDSSGFNWQHYDGSRNLQRVIPSSTEPFRIKGDNILGSGFYLRYREIVKMMGDNNLADWGYPSGLAWPNMEIGGNGYWKNIQNLNINRPDGPAYSKIEKPHYHEYIYRGTEQEPYLFGGIFYKTKANYTVSSADSSTYVGWEVPASSHHSLMQSYLTEWPGEPYNYTSLSVAPVRFNVKTVLGANSIASGNYFPSLDINTYTQFITYPDTRLPFAQQQYLDARKTIGFLHSKGSRRQVNVTYGLDLSYSGIYVDTGDYRYIKSSGITGYSPPTYTSAYAQVLDNAFSAEFYPLDITVFNNEFTKYINRKLVYILGNENLNLGFSVSGITTGIKISGIADFYGCRSGYLLDNSPYPAILPVYDSHTEYSCLDNWNQNFKLVCGFIQLSGSNAVRGSYYGGYTPQETTLIGNKTASKLRSGNYYNLFDFTVEYPTELHLGTIFSAASSYLWDITDISNLYSSGDNTIFLAAFSYPFEGSGLDVYPCLDSPTELTLSGYILPRYKYNLTSEGYLNAFPQNETIRRTRQGGLAQITETPFSALPSSIYLRDMGRLQHNMLWW